MTALSEWDNGGREKEVGTGRAGVDCGSGIARVIAMVVCRGDWIFNHDSEHAGWTQYPLS